MIRNFKYKLTIVYIYIFINNIKVIVKLIYKQLTLLRSINKQLTLS
jgi:hypothetical protein